MSFLSDSETVRAFDSDVNVHEGYVYTTNDRLSSRLARQRWVETVLGMTEMKGRKLLDLGCGDGYFTRLYLRHTSADEHRRDRSFGECDRVSDCEAG